MPISGCGSIKADEDTTYPIDPDDARRISRGRLTGPDGWTLFGRDDSSAGVATGGVSSIAVNSLLWKATLDTVSFMPLASTDPFGGVIITDWYESPEKPGERFKLHVVISDRALRADALNVNVFRQVRGDDAQWRDVAVSKGLGRDFEDIILTRARELRMKQGG